MTEGILRVGVAGLATDHVWRMGDGFANLPNARIVAAAEPRFPEQREKAAARWQIDNLYEDYEEMMAKAPIDAILLTTDNRTKPEVVEIAARRGKHVVMDKPMGATLADAERIVQAAKEGNIQVMCAYHTWFEPMFLETFRLLQAGTIGPVFLARAHIGHAGPVAFGCSKYFCEWLFDRDRNGGGAFVDDGCYGVNMLRYCLGEPQSVTALMGQLGNKSYLPANVEDNSIALIRFRNGAIAEVSSVWGLIGGATWGEKKWPVFGSYHGQSGTIVQRYDELQVYETDPMKPYSGEWRSIPLPYESGQGGPEQRYFTETILAGKRIEGAVTVEMGRATHEIIEAAYRSAETGRTIELPL